MAKVATVSAVCLNQFALDFEGNYKRILASIVEAKRQKSRFRSGPELEISGYSCEDHFYEPDTRLHSWEVLAALLVAEECQDILCDVGMPIMHNGVTYNCRVVFLNKKILLIRPKMTMCDDGNYRESRWFTPWLRGKALENHRLPEFICNITDQDYVPIGDALLQLRDTCIAFEICEELWAPKSPHIEQSLAGAEIIVNSSGSHTEIRKSNYAIELISTASAKTGTAYMFSNLRGCDGERVYLNGISVIAVNGSVLKMGEQYSLKDVEVTTASIDLEVLRAHKASFRSRSNQAAVQKQYPAIAVSWSLVHPKRLLEPTVPLPAVTLLCAEEEIARGPALWMWDYLRRSGASGFFLPLSGGVDSSSVAIITYSMCNLICEYWKATRDPQVLADVRKVLKDDSYEPTCSKALCGQILATCYMGSINSSAETRQRADKLAAAIGSQHFAINISPVTDSFVETVSAALGATPSFSGTRTENLALQNVQARSRMVYAYLFAQLVPWAKRRGGFMLVLGTANVDEAIRGYFTKYDCSSADLNPIGGISKTDLKSFIIYAGDKFQLQEVREIVEAPPTAELQPLESKQTDEADMGMTYEELSAFGKLRKPLACGPFSMAARLLHIWKGKHVPEETARKVKHFYTSYAMNRHKMTTLTPACHMENYSPEDHRFDLRPMLYPTNFTWQYRKIDEMVQDYKESEVD